MQKKFGTIRDYHIKDDAIRVESADWPSLRVAVLAEGSGDIQFARTDRNGLVLTLDGSAAHLTRMAGIDDETPSSPGEVCLIPVGVDLHLAWRNRTPVQRTLMVEFDDTLFQTYAPEVAGETFLRGHMIPANFAARPTLKNLMRLLARETDPAQAQGRLFADTAIRLLALEIAASAWSVPTLGPEVQGRPDVRLRRAVDFIEAHFTTDISILDISAAAGLGPTQLTRAFRLTTGQTPYAYVIDRRLRHAARLLRTTDLPIAYIALEAGFSDQAHLTRLCRARLGKTPRQIRQG